MPLIKAIVTAGGTSRRFGSGNKLLEDLKGKPVIKYSVDLFTDMGFDVIIPTHNSFLCEIKEIFKDYTNVTVIQGGLTRQQSVFRGLKEADKCDYIIVHDGARPLIKKETVEKCLSVAVEKGAAIVAVHTTDTIKTVDVQKKITGTPQRINLINVQTPQIFRYSLLLEAHLSHLDCSMTDDSALVESSGSDVYYVEGEYSNIKITNQIDMDYAKLLLETL